MPSADESTGRRGCGRWILRCVVLCVVLAGVLGAALYTGHPQRLAANAIVSSALDGNANFVAVRLGDPLIVQGLTLSEKAASIYGPVLKVERAEAGYHLSPENGRYISSVALSGVRLSLQQGAATNNFQFLLDRFSQPGGGGDATPWIPEQIGLDGLWLETNFPDYYLRAENLNFDATLASTHAGSVSFGSPEVALAWSSTFAPGGPQSGSGTIAVDATWKDDGANLDAVVDLGLLARLRGSASVVKQDDTKHYTISLPEAVLNDPLWAAMLADRMPLPVRFDGLTLKDSDVNFHIPADGIVVDQANVDATITALVVGPSDAPYYSGPLQLAVHGNYGQEAAVTGTVTLRDQLALEAALTFGADGVSGSFAWEPWPREDLLALTPPDYAGILTLLEPLQRLGAKGTVVQSDGGLAMDATLTAGFSAETLQIPLSLAWGPDSELSVSADAALGESRIQSTVSMPQGAPLMVENTLTGVSPNAWAALLLGKELLPGFTSALSGTAKLVLSSDQPIAIDANLSSAGLTYGTIALPAESPISLVGKMTFDSTTGTLRGGPLALAQAGTADIHADKWSFNTGKATLDAALNGTLTLDVIGSVFSIPDLSGEAKIVGQLSAGSARTSLSDFTAESDSLAYGEDWTVPYGSLLALAGSLAYDTAASTLNFEPIRATLGDGTRCSLGSLALQFPVKDAPFRMNSTGLSFESDLKLLVNRSVLASATDTQFLFTSDALAWTGETFSGLTKWDLKASEIALPEKMASFVNLAYAGEFDPGQNEPRKSRLTADSFAVYEIPFGPVDTELELTPKKLICDSLETTFLGGTLAMSGEVDYRDAAFPASVKARVEHLDLEQFTETFKPPDVMMTGKVSGTADLVLSAEGLQDLNVDMTASENLTLNQAAVRQILMQQYVNDAVGSKKIQQIIEKVIGKDEQRAFDKAILTLRLEAGLIVGEARLESKNLDVTVDIKAEPEAILQAIQSASENG